MHRRVIAVCLTRRVPYSTRDLPPAAHEVLRNIGRRVRHLRMAMGLSQRALAAMTDIDQSVISRFENGLAPGMRVDKAAAILAALGADRLDRLQPADPTSWAASLAPANLATDDALWGIESDPGAVDALWGIEMGA